MPGQKKGSPLTGKRFGVMRERNPLLAEVLLDSLRWTRAEIDDDEFRRRLIAAVDKMKLEEGS